MAEKSIEKGVARRQSPQRPERKGFPTGGWVKRGRTGTRRDRTPLILLGEPGRCFFTSYLLSKGD